MSLNPDTVIAMERIFLQAAARVLAADYPPRADVIELERMAAFLRAEKRHWRERLDWDTQEAA